MSSSSCAGCFTGDLILFATQSSHIDVMRL
jgi:hypothetical protein